eukprot:211746-Rhodomonas_salina.1
MDPADENQRVRLRRSGTKRGSAWVAQAAGTGKLTPTLQSTEADAEGPEQAADNKHGMGKARTRGPKVCSWCYELPPQQESPSRLLSGVF